MKTPKPKDPIASAEIEDEEKDVVEKESPAKCVVEIAPEEPGLIDSTALVRVLKRILLQPRRWIKSSLSS